MPDVESVRPQMGSRHGINEPRRDANAALHPANAAFKHVVHPLVAPDVPYVHSPALVGEAQTARDDRKPAELRKLGRDVLYEALDESVLFGVLRNAREGKNCYRGLAGKLQRSRSLGVMTSWFVQLRASSTRPIPLPHLTDETKSFAGNSAN